MRARDRVIGILLGLVLGVAIVVAFVFLGSGGTIDAPSISGDGGASTENQAPASKPEQPATKPGKQP